MWNTLLTLLCRWSSLEEVFVYESGYNGVIWDILVNNTDQPNSIFVIGTFDTFAKSQDQFCSVGKFDGQSVQPVCLAVFCLFYLISV